MTEPNFRETPSGSSLRRKSCAEAIAPGRAWRSSFGRCSNIDVWTLINIDFWTLKTPFSFLHRSLLPRSTVLVSLGKKFETSVKDSASRLIWYLNVIFTLCNFCCFKGHRDEGRREQRWGGKQSLSFSFQKRQETAEGQTFTELFLVEKRISVWWTIL